MLLLLALLGATASQADCSDSFPWRNITPSLASEGISFTFSSPAHPWTESELNILRMAVSDFYPVIEGLYGPPAFPVTVNLRKDPWIWFSGEYSPVTKEIILRDAAQLDVLCHEMIHAFRDENMILIDSYEEGMTRAVQVEVFNRLPGYAFWNENHSYMYDVFYEGLNTRIMGSQSGNFDYASPFLLLRYNLAGYAWAKVFLENPAFFADFNRELYFRSLSDPSILTDAVALREIARLLQPVVEGKPFLKWYEQQGIFNSAPQEGYFLYQNISNFNVYYFLRDGFGSDIPVEGSAIDWEIYDYEDNLISTGSDETSGLGWISIKPALPAGYTGRIKIVASALSPYGLAGNTAFAPVGDNKGIFGIIKGNDAGVAVVTALDGAAPPAVAGVERGMFNIPSLAGEKGRFIALFSGKGGRTFSKQFNKDAADYFLPLVESGSVSDLSLSITAAPGPGVVGKNLTYALKVGNNGPDAAAEIFLADSLPAGVTFLSASPSQGSCVFFSPTVVCALNTVNKGASASVLITVIPTQTGNIDNNAFAAANAADPDITNNSVAISSTIADINPAIISIRSVIGRIWFLPDQRIVNTGRAKALIALLEAAIGNIERGRTVPALNQIKAFVREVSALVRTGILPRAEGEALISEANGIISLLTRQRQALSP